MKEFALLVAPKLAIIVNVPVTATDLTLKQFKLDGSTGQSGRLVVSP
jgi:hypothetical protein